MEKGGPATPAPHVGLPRRWPFCELPPLGARFPSLTSRSPPPSAPQTLPPLPCRAPSPFFLTPPAAGFFLAADVTSPRPGAGISAGRGRGGAGAVGRARRAREASARRGCLSSLLSRGSGGLVSPSLATRAGEKRVLFQNYCLTDSPFAFSVCATRVGGEGLPGACPWGGSPPCPPAPGFFVFRIILYVIKHFQGGEGKDACHTEADEIRTYRGTHGCLF